MVLFWLQETKVKSDERTTLALQLYLGISSLDVKQASKTLSKLNLARWNEKKSLVLTSAGRDWLRLAKEDLRPKFSRVYFPNLCLRQRQALRFLASPRCVDPVSPRRLAFQIGIHHPKKLIDSLLLRRLIYRTKTKTINLTKLGRDWATIDRERRGLSLIS
jgi:hypothetical protein